MDIYTIVLIVAVVIACIYYFLRWFERKIAPMWVDKLKKMDQIDVIIGFYLHTSSGLGAASDEIVDVSGIEKTKNRLRDELGFSESIPVKIFYGNEWKMPKVNKQEDVYNQGVLTTIVDHMCAAQVELDVQGDVVNEFKRKDFEVLKFPTSGRVLLFQAIRASQNSLGRLI